MEQKKLDNSLQPNHQKILQIKEEELSQQKDSKLKQQQNSLTFLNKTLSSLNNQFFKRSNTDKNPLRIHQTLKGRQQQQLIQSFQNNYIQPRAQNTFSPQPWESHQTQNYYLNFRQQLTQGRQKYTKQNNFQRSFKTSNSFSKTNRQKYNSKIFSINEFRKSSYPEKNNQTEETINASSFMTDCQLDENRRYRYSNQQKIKLSLDYIIQKKKHSKRSKILKMKTQSFDKTLIKKENINHQSKNLIEALERFPSDRVLKRSINHAVEVLKKRSNRSNERNKLKKPQKLNQTMRTIQDGEINLLQCRKIDISQITLSNRQQIKKCDFSDKKLMTLSNLVGIQKNILAKQTCKLSFKPKRNFILESKKFKNDYKTRINQNKLGKDKSLVIMDKKFSIAEFLKVNHFKI